MKKKYIITIDGVSSCGKTTLSKWLSKKLNWPYFVTGILYRGIAFVGNTNQFTKQDYLKFIKDQSQWLIKTTSLNTLFFYKGKNITKKLHSIQVDNWSSILSKKPFIRTQLVSFQRNFFSSYKIKGFIFEGRDCGTKIFPKADLKIFLHANKKVRARRRAKDRKRSPHFILKKQTSRDNRDTLRKHSPCHPAKDSLIIDTSYVSVTKVANQILKHIKL